MSRPTTAPFRRAALCGVAALSLAAPAWAQEVDSGEILVTAQQTNRTLVIRGGQVGVLGDKAAADVPFAIKSYSNALILNQQPQTLGQVLENDPSVRIGYAYGNAAELFIVRGFPLFGDDIALDGLYGLMPRQLISPELYAQVQVLNGASAFLNGAAPGGSALGGSVNLTPKRAGDAPLTRATLNVSGDAHYGGSFDIGRRLGDDGAFGIRINGSARRGDVGIDDEFRSSYVIGAGFDWRGERARLSLDLAYQRAHVRSLRPKVFVDLAGAVPAVPRASSNFAQPWAYTTLRDVFGMLRGEYDITDSIMAYAAIGMRDGSEKGVYAGIAVTDPVTGDGNGDGAYIPRTDNNESAQAGIRATFDTGPVRHELNLGGSAIRQVNRNAYDFFVGYATNLYDAPTVAQPPSAFAGGDLQDPFPISRTRLRSLFVSDTLSVADERVMLTVGLRRQNMRIMSYSYMDGTFAGQYDESATTPVIGLVVKAVGGVSLYANRIQALAQGPTAPLDGNLVNSGAVFAPYKSTQYEIGGKVNFGTFNASLAVYQTRQPSAFTREAGAAEIPAGFTPANPAQPTLIFALDGEQRNRGIEFSVDGEPTPGLRIIGGATINDARLKKTAGGVNAGNDVVGVPEYMINANVEWDLAFLPGATLTGRVVRTGKQQVNLANTLEIPAWTRFDLGARYVLLLADKPLTLRAGVDNVANKRYWSSSYDAFRSSVLQGTPRIFKLSASIDL